MKVRHTVLWILLMTGFIGLLPTTSVSSSLYYGDLFRFSVDWRESVSPANQDLDRNGNGILDEGDLLLLLQQRRYDLETPTPTVTSTPTATHTPTPTPTATQPPVPIPTLVAEHFLKVDGNFPSAASFATGDYVLSYQRGSSVRARLYRANASPLDNEITMPGGTSRGAVAVGPDDRFRLVYQYARALEFYLEKTPGIYYTLVSGHHIYPAIAIDSQGIAAVVWESRVYSPEQVLMAYMDKDGKLNQHAYFLSSEDHRTQEDPDVAVNRNRDFLAVWARGGNKRIQANFFSERRPPVEREYFDLASPILDSLRIKPRVTALGDNYAVIWDDRRDHSEGQVYARMVDRFGKLIGNEEYRVDDSPSFAQLPAITILPGANRYLICWSDGRHGGYSLYGRYLNAEGQPVGASFLLAHAERRIEYISLAASTNIQGDFVLVWEEDRRVRASLYRIP